MGNPKNLTDLPVEVLDVIFKYLNMHGSDKWHLADVHPVLGKAFTYHIRDFYACLQVNYNSSQFMRIVVPLCGATIRRIEVAADFDEFYKLRELIDKYCTNLQILDLDISSHQVSCLKEFFSTSVKAKSVDVHIRIKSKNIGKIMDLLTQHPKVKSLQLRNVSIGDDRFVQQLVNLEALGLHYGPFQTKNNFYELLLPLKSLRNLEIMATVFHNSISSEELPFCALQSLTIKNCIVMVLQSFPNLKSINIESNFLFEDFFKWVSNHKNTLEKLTFKITNEEFQINKFFEMLRSCTKLREIYLKMDIDNILDSSVVTTFVSILKENGISFQNQLKLRTTKKTRDTMNILLRDIPDSTLVDVFSYDW